MNWISIVKFYPKGKQKFLHPHYYVHKLFSDKSKFRYSEINGCFFIYSMEKPAEPEDINVEILSVNRFRKPIDGETYSFVIKYSQSVKSNGKRHDLIQHMKQKGANIGSAESIRIGHFAEKFSDIGAFFKEIVIYNSGSEYIYGKKLKKTWVEFRGLIQVEDGANLFKFLCKGRGAGKGYGLGIMFLGEA